MFLGTVGQSDEDCSGDCFKGYYCPAGSASPTQNQCGEGFYCPMGTGTAAERNVSLKLPIFHIPMQ